MPTSGELERDRIRKQREIVITDFTTCYYCKSTGLAEGDKFCPHCGFPQRGVQQEMLVFLYNVKRKKELLEQHKKKVQRARTVLFVVGGLQFVAGIVIAVLIPSAAAAILIIQAIIGALFLGLGFWCKTNPFAASLTGFFVYIVLLVINGVMDPSTIGQGMFLKIAIISALVYGYRSVKEAEKLETELADLKTSVNLNDEVPQMSEGK